MTVSPIQGFENGITLLSRDFSQRKLQHRSAFLDLFRFVRFCAIRLSPKKQGILDQCLGSSPAHGFEKIHVA
jgi:hypothetical protein